MAGKISPVDLTCMTSQLKPTITVVKKIPSIDDSVMGNKQAAAEPQLRPGQRMEGHRAATDIEEKEESIEVVQEKMKILGGMMKASARTVVFTGAGISTAASIPDFRGPSGVWTMQDRGVFGTTGVAMENARPTEAHDLLAAWVQRGAVEHVISTNSDNLHHKSGIPFDSLSELHGNCFIERCAVCKEDILREFDVTQQRIDDPMMVDTVHGTGRRCEQCQRFLRDNLIHFGEDLNPEILARAEEESKQADLAIVFGTSLRVVPAMDLPQMAKKMVIVNLQTTPLDDKADLVVHARLDVAARLMDEATRA